jgi:4-alpha-glucanotransferase
MSTHNETTSKKCAIGAVKQIRPMTHDKPNCLEQISQEGSEKIWNVLGIDDLQLLDTTPIQATAPEKRKRNPFLHCIITLRKYRDKAIYFTAEFGKLQEGFLDQHNELCQTQGQLYSIEGLSERNAFATQAYFESSNRIHNKVMVQAKIEEDLKQEIRARDATIEQLEQKIKEQEENIAEIQRDNALREEKAFEMAKRMRGSTECS